MSKKKKRYNSLPASWYIRLRKVPLKKTAIQIFIYRKNQTLT